MKVYNCGAFVRVTVSASEVDAFNERWPCSPLRGRKSFEFQVSNGDLVDTNARDDEDGDALLALAQDAQNHAARKLGIPSLFRV